MYRKIGNCFHKSLSDILYFRHLKLFLIVTIQVCVSEQVIIIMVRS